MAFKLTKEAQDRVAAYAAYAEDRQIEFANMTNGNLVASAKMYMAHMEPRRYAPGEPVYDATMWHAILPELLRRVGRIDG
jgi:hypothetical protein